MATKDCPIFLTTNMQADGVSRLKRIEIEFDQWSYQLYVNPEEYTQTESSRSTITQTKGGAWADEFGGGVPHITMKGTTGFKSTTNDRQLGFVRFKMLRDHIRRRIYAQAPGTEIISTNEMIFHNYTDGEHWVVLPKVFTLMRSVARPLLYLYQMEFDCLRPANIPSAQATADSAALQKRLSQINM